MVWTACRHTTYAAARRQMKAAPTPDPDVANDFIKHSMNIINKEVGDDLKHFSYSVTDWYNHLNTRKQKALEHVIQYYHGDSMPDMTPEEQARLLNFHYSGILKEELQPTDGKPRLVCSIPQRTKFIMGPITWHLEEIFSDKLRGYCGGKNLDQMSDMINDYLALGFTKVVEGDGSAFDNTQDVSLKAIDRKIYQQLYHSIYHVPLSDFEHVSQALYKTMDIEYIDPKTKKKKLMLSYDILGTVFSGDCDTTLMNTTRMALYNRYVNDKAGLVFGKDYICFAKGDDFTVMYKPYVKDEFIRQAYYRYFLTASESPDIADTRIFGIGQILKFLTFGDASTISFCSLKAWFKNVREDAIYLTRDPFKLLSLGLYSRKLKGQNNEYAYHYYVQQAISLEKSYKGIRFFELMAGMYRAYAQYIATKFPLDPRRLARIAKHSTGTIQQPSDTTLTAILSQLEAQQQFIAHRRDQYKIGDSYWETMQQIERIHVTTLTEEEADYVSQQMETTTLLVEYVKAILGEGPNKN